MLMFLITLGYLAVSLFLHENHELNMLLVNTLQRVRGRKGRVGREEGEGLGGRKGRVGREGGEGWEGGKEGSAEEEEQGETSVCLLSLTPPLRT